MSENNNYAGTVKTVLGPVKAEELGKTLIHENILSIYPGAEFAPEIDMDHSTIFEKIKHKLMDFKRAGGKTVVDYSGMFHGRDINMYKVLSQTTGVHIVSTTGLGPEKMLSGYFTTPQKQPPEPWPAESFASLFIKEIEEGIVVPRVERSSLAGMVTSIASQEGLTVNESNLFRGSAQAAMKTGVPVSVQYGANAEQDLAVILKEGIATDRIIIGDLDRLQAVEKRAAFTIAEQGAYVALDHVGWSSTEGYIHDEARAQLVAQLFEAGLGEKVLVSSNATGVAKGHEGKDIGFDYVLTHFVPLLRKAGLTEEEITILLEKNPQRILTVAN